MRKRGETRYQAKITDDNGLTRGRVPCPLLKKMGARPGDFMIFRFADSGGAIMRVSRSKGAGRSSKANRGRISKRS